MNVNLKKHWQREVKNALTRLKQQFILLKKKFTRKFIDNKIDLLEKILSTTQRDLVYLNLAREELCVRQNMIHELTEPTKESNKAFPQNPQPVLENPLEMVWPR